MERQYLIDSNAVIDFLNGKLPDNGKKFMAAIIPAISVITQIELLSNKNIPLREWAALEAFIDAALIYSLDGNVVQQTIALRQDYKLKTPDAIIGATALTNGFTLITRNTGDFKNIDTLHLLDPWTIA